LRRILENPLKHDLPELDGIGNIHNAEEAIEDAQQLAARTYGARRTWFLVNGSTSGVLAAILACVRIHRVIASHKQSEQVQVTKFGQGNKSILLMGRDSHKSAFDAISLADCEAALLPCIVENEFGISLGVQTGAIEEALKTYGSDVCGLLLTRPTYQGVCTDTDTLREIAELCHAHNVPLIIDEAHGSHLRFLKDPDLEDALACGADLVVQSTHKSLTSLTQSGMLHLGTNSFQYVMEKLPIDMAGWVADTVHGAYSSLTSTSPSALMLASLDAARAHMDSDDGREMVQASLQCVASLSNALRNSTILQLLADSGEVRKRGLRVDPFRLTAGVRPNANGVSALDVDDAMCESDGVYCELNLRDCVTYALPIGSTMDSLEPLRESLLNHSERLYRRAMREQSDNDTVLAERARNPHVREDEEATLKMSKIANGNHCAGSIGYLERLGDRSFSPFAMKSVRIESAAGSVAAETISPYPPGIPVLVKGEVITQMHVAQLQTLCSADSDVRRAKSGRTITGCADPTLSTVRVFVK
jgi:arginine/lysine/ornithine decarboxylase